MAIFIADFHLIQRIVLVFSMVIAMKLAMELLSIIIEKIKDNIKATEITMQIRRYFGWCEIQ